MVVDSSALVSILLVEDGHERFARALGLSPDSIISVATVVESSIVIAQRRGNSGLVELDTLLQTSSVRSVPVDAPQAAAARDAWLRFGKGRHPAGLNFGDCFSYALATTTGRPLLFKGEDFAQTDVVSAVAPLSAGA